MTDQPRRRRYSIGVAIDWFFFVFAGLAAVWLAYLSFTETFNVGWWGIAVAIVFWVLLAYLVLPRLHRILTTVYVPDYFIGRARTSDGLLGDPVNLAFLGEADQIHAAMRAAGWTQADDVTLGSSWRIVTSTLTRRSYGEAPVSPLFLFSRQQDFAYQQEVDGNPAQRHHVRFWKCPDGWLLPGGSRVDWLAAGTFDTAVGLSLFTLQVTHRIDADTDIERDHIVHDGHRGRCAGRGLDAEGLLDRLSRAKRRRRQHPHRRRSADRRRQRDEGGDAVTDAPHKRPAFEPASELLKPVSHDPEMKRPPSTVAGVLLVFLRVLAGLIVVVSILLDWRNTLKEVDVSVEGVESTPETRTGCADRRRDLARCRSGRRCRPGAVHPDRPQLGARDRDGVLRDLDHRSVHPVVVRGSGDHDHTGLS